MNLIPHKHYDSYWNRLGSELTYLRIRKKHGTFIPAYYDLAVIDVRMPGMNGFELYSEIKSLDYKIKVLFLTALTDLHDYDDFNLKYRPDCIRDNSFKSR